MVRKFLNRLFGRTDSITDAINAYVEGNASADEVKLVEQMMRDDPALEKDLATQRALLDVLGRIGGVEAPRSFAITPEMVAAAEGSRSGISKLADLFAPQRKLALAPMVLAGFAALTVALLTIGDITGVVEQSGRGESVSRASAAAGVPAEAESAAPVAGGAATSELSLADDSVAGEPELEMATEAEAGVSDAGADGSLELEKSIEPPEAEAAAAMAAPESSDFDEAADADGPPSLSSRAPVPEGVDAETELSPEEQATQLEQSAPKAPAGLTELESAPVAGTGGELVDDGIKLPLWQLQVALAALVLAVIGAWAGLRRVRRD